MVTSLHSTAVKKNQGQFCGIIPSLEPHVHHYQKTIASVVGCQGIGVHSGTPVTLTLRPAAVGSGIIFIRTDLGNVEVKASWKTVTDTRFCTTIGNDQGIRISTIEHLMAALAASGIDNIRVEIDGPELPILDGSAQPFVSLVEEAGVYDQRVSRQVIRVLKTVTVTEGDRKASLSPAPYYELEVDFDFAGRTALAPQNLIFRPLEEDFSEELSSARTFGLLEDAEKLWAMGLSKGASLDNTLVYDGMDVINEDGLRFDDECVRHKALDALGDLHLAGGLILGKFHGIRTGHSLHHKLLTALFADPTAWTIDGR
ncbi:MAG: UDP-3-O-[3-hydroxymyristoyl] N-acetylglucosamine deacetylase [Alphaproteobacteria bacterium]|nr:UDP-3-O-[3-hydroxymyristoyl] N-acetylglucosamine deacetylase [Alphaproteobacteria bacterium]